MKRKRILYGVLIAVVLLVGAGFWYVRDYYHSVEVEKYLVSSKEVEVSELEEGWFFDGKGTEKALVFYPGAKVEVSAYAPILYQLAEEGVDCFLVEMPCNLAIFGVDKAEDIQKQYTYGQWYLAGHSMGGAMAAAYCADHLKEVDGLIFLAAYSANDLTEGEFPVLSVYGENDGVLNMEKVEAGRELMPEQYEEIEIAGGNHAGFGSYGEQKGDGEASIPQKVQWNETVQIILDWMSL